MGRVFPIKDRIVYTINYGGYDKVIENHYSNDNWDWYLITDYNLKSKFWNVIYEPQAKNAKREARKYKWLVHKLFDCKYSLYIDANIRVLTNLDELVAEYLNGYDIAAYKHRYRDCLYDEGAVCKYFKLDDAKTIKEQLDHYCREGYPFNAGLNEGGVLLRRHTDKIKEFNEFEWEQIQKGSYRDQLSFNYTAWKLKIKINSFKGMIKLYPEAKEVLEEFYGKEIKYKNPYFEMEKHLET